jgi:SHS2 domain-containing protein
MVRLCCPEGTIRRAVARPVKTAGTDLVELLVNWLSEINSLGSLQHELYGAVTIAELTRAEDGWRVVGHVQGEPIDRERHKLACEIKAVTFHQAEVVGVGDGWRARVIFDL